MTHSIIAALLVLISMTAIAAVRLRNLFAATMLLSIYSLLMAMTWQIMKALDVAFTEASVGAGISTILLLAALIHCGSKEKPHRKIHLPALFAVLATGALLLYGTTDMPRLGDAKAPVHQRASAFYNSKEAWDLTHVPNVVTSTLGSFRGYDTMYETCVIFVAGASVILLLRSRKGMREAGVREEGGAKGGEVT